MISSLTNISSDNYPSLESFQGVAEEEQINTLLQSGTYKIYSLELVDSNIYSVELRQRSTTQILGLKQLLKGLTNEEIISATEDCITVKYTENSEFEQINMYRIISITMASKNEIHLQLIPEVF